MRRKYVFHCVIHAPSKPAGGKGFQCAFPSQRPSLLFQFFLKYLMTLSLPVPSSPALLHILNSSILWAGGPGNAAAIGYLRSFLLGAALFIDLAIIYLFCNFHKTTWLLYEQRKGAKFRYSMLG